MKKSIFCFAFTAALLLALLPGAAFAQEGGELADGDFIYVGSFEGSPIKWRVLDADAMNTGEPGAFLFSEYILQKAGTAYAGYEAGWQGSLAQQWCADFYSSAFSVSEQSLIPAVSKQDEEAQLFGLRWRAEELIDENVFFISSPELAEYVGGGDGAPGLSGYTSSGQAGYYWLRTSHRNHPDYAGLVLEDDQVHDFLVYIVWGTKPAMNLSMSDVLCLRPAYEGAESEWKLTAVDASRALTLGAVTLDGGTLTAEYSGASTGEGEYISLLVRGADGNTVSCRRLCPCQSASGSVKIELSSLDIPEGGGIYLLSEKDNGDFLTCYASQPLELCCHISFDPGEGSGEMEPISLTPGLPAALPDCGFTAAPGRRFDHWELDGEAVTELTPKGDTLLTAVYTDILVSDISFQSGTLEMALFDSCDISAAVSPADAANTGLTWSSSSKSCVRVVQSGANGCTVKARSPGTALITASSADGGAEAGVTVTVTGSPLAAFAVNYGPYILAALALAAAALLLLKKRRK